MGHPVTERIDNKIHSFARNAPNIPALIHNNQHPDFKHLAWSGFTLIPDDSGVTKC